MVGMEAETEKKKKKKKKKKGQAEPDFILSGSLSDIKL